MRSEHSVNKMAHGRYPVAVTYTSNLYEAPEDAQGNPIPFAINSQEDGVIRVLLVDAADYVDIFFQAGDSPSHVIGIDDRGALSTNLVALFPYKPAATTINTTY